MYNDSQILEKYKVPKAVTFDTLNIYLVEILNAYRVQVLSLNDIKNIGDSITSFIYNKYINPENPEYPSFPEEDKRSMALKVLEYMESMDFWMLPKDVPYFVEFLETPIGKEKEGWEIFQKYISSLRLRDRIKEEEKQEAFRSGYIDLDKPFEPL